MLQQSSIGFPKAMRLKPPQSAKVFFLLGPPVERATLLASVGFEFTLGGASQEGPAFTFAM